MSGLAAGELISDRYRLDRRIAVGGMGEVWEASDTRLGRSVAVKILKSDLSDDPEFLHRFRIEARTVASLGYSGIAGVHDYGEDDGPAGGGRTAYLVMELVRGEPLSARIARGPIPADETLDILEQSARALQAAHERGFVHRDVKPGNILLREDGVVKLTDFGIAKAADAAPVTRSGMVMGTAHYIAPEQASGEDAGPAGDVYSLGIVGYECLAGVRPFRAESAVAVAMMQVRDDPPPLPDTVPAHVRELIDSVLVKDPTRRYADGGEFAEAVAAVRRGHRPPVAGTPAPAGDGPSLLAGGDAAGTARTAGEVPDEASRRGRHGRPDTGDEGRAARWTPDVPGTGGSPVSGAAPVAEPRDPASPRGGVPSGQAPATPPPSTPPPSTPPPSTPPPGSAPPGPAGGPGARPGPPSGAFPRPGAAPGSGPVPLPPGQPPRGRPGTPPRTPADPAPPSAPSPPGGQPGVRPPGDGRRAPGARPARRAPDSPPHGAAARPPATRRSSERGPEVHPSGPLDLTPRRSGRVKAWLAVLFLLLTVAAVLLAVMILRDSSQTGLGAGVANPATGTVAWRTPAGSRPVGDSWPLAARDVAGATDAPR
ncbi:serine/threonine-protein kinase [Pseudonocardia phyllosphaerae]|uniref:serine/threonine-protein kinase n=1 Tax=Pseudonocardia phyllosphaerae TaxID=3390502 RepID=UPI00397AC6E2